MNKAPMALLSAKLACLTIATMASLATTEAKANWVGLGNQNGILQLKTQREFDYFALALQWPATYCRRSSHCCTSNACCRGSNAPTEFTIHGLWPDYNDGSWPSCCTQKRFNEKEISTLLDALEKYWPSLSCSSSSTCHGEKHGTCSSPITGDEYNYFLTTLNVYFKYNVTRVLYEAGYVPSNREKYPLGGIISAIQNAFHATPLVVCRNGALEELRLCFYKNFEPRDCVTEATQNDMVSSRNSCPSYIGLPEYVSRGKFPSAVVT
ncbi:Ribonuclease T2-like [Parasponia andersonii]|uniref:Ribonuclease T2-like n=1 Tax=Parasponia andersonii TaxID=3476 RepID=A0A2P5DPG2_PARAD|nr:Ribonuclease T2-like [Parasponia andersonii]